MSFQTELAHQVALSVEDDVRRTAIEDVLKVAAAAAEAGDADAESVCAAVVASLDASLDQAEEIVEAAVAQLKSSW